MKRVKDVPIPTTRKKRNLTSDPPLKETVLGVFDLAEIVAGGSKNKQIDGFCAKFFSKSIAKNRNRLAFVVWEIFKKN
jgi:hypothetical protein